MADPYVKKLAQRLLALETDIRNISIKPQLDHSTVEGGNLGVNDDYGNPTMVIGGQYDGTNAPAVVNGPVPPTPTTPLVTPEGVGVLVVYWDGTFEDALVAPMDFSRVTVHAVPSADFVGYDPTNQAYIVGSFDHATGGELSAALPIQEYVVYLVAWTIAGKFGAGSAAVLGTPDEVDMSAVQEEIDELQVIANAAQASADAASSAAAAAQSDADAAATSAAAAQSAAAAAQTDASQAIADAATAQTAADDAHDIAVAAQGAVDTVSDAAAAAQAAADAAQGDATQALSDAADAASLAATANSLASSAETIANGAQTDATQALSDAADAASDAATAQAAADQANGAATDAQTAADNAQAAADAANAAALDAAGLAGTKGKVIIQSSAPAAGDRLPQNLWIDTTGGANTPKRWNGTAWVAVQDADIQAAADAAAAAASTAAAAQSDADAAAVAAAAAQTDATQALQDASDAADAAAEALDGITVIDTRLTTAEGTLSTHDTEITTAQGQISTLQSGLTTAQTDISNVEDRVTTAEGELTTVQSDVSGVTGDVSLLTTRVTNAEGGITTLDGRVDTAEATIVTHSSRLDDAEDDITNITTVQLPGKNKMNYGTSNPTSSTPGIPGDVYWVRSSNNVTTMYLCTAGTGTSSGNTWTAQTYGTNVINNLAITAAKIANGTITTTQLATAVNNSITTAGTNASTALTNAATAQSAADAAQSTANTAVSNAAAAQSAADDAAADAAAAAGIADSKADVLIQSSAPATAMQKSSTLWIDTTGGANTPKRWSGSAWVVVTDKAATDAAAAAAAAASAASTAQATADGAVADAAAAQAAAEDAQSAADAASLAATNAQTSANGKSRVTYGSSAPTSTTPGRPGDIFWVRTGNTIVGQYLNTAGTDTSSGNTWVEQTLTSATIAALDAGKITTGSLSADRIAAGSLTAAKLVTGTITAASGVIADAAIGAAQIIDGSIGTAEIGDASITNAKIQDATIQAAKIASIDAGTITTGTLAAARIAAGTITTTMIAAAGLDAATIKTGTLDAARIAAGSITANKLLMKGDELLENGGFEQWTSSTQPVSWASSANIAASAAYLSDADSTKCLQFTAPSAAATEITRSSVKIYAKPGDVFRLRWAAAIQTFVTGTASYELSAVPGSGSTGSVAIDTINFTGVGSSEREVLWTVPAGWTSEFVIIRLVVRTTASGQVAFFDGLSVQRGVGASLIVDGSITASKLSVDFLTANDALINALNVVDLSTTTLEAVNISGGTIAIGSNDASSATTDFGTGTSLPAGWSVISDVNGSVPTFGVVNSLPGNLGNGFQPAGSGLRIQSGTSGTSYTDTERRFEPNSGTLAPIFNGEVEALYYFNAAPDPAKDDIRLYLRRWVDGGNLNCVYITLTDLSSETDSYYGSGTILCPKIYQTIAGVTTLVGVCDNIDMGFLAAHDLGGSQNGWHWIKARLIDNRIEVQGGSQHSVRAYFGSNVFETTIPSHAGTFGIWQKRTGTGTGMMFYLDRITLSGIGSGFFVDGGGTVEIGDQNSIRTRLNPTLISGGSMIDFPDAAMPDLEPAGITYFKQDLGGGTIFTALDLKGATMTPDLAPTDSPSVSIQGTHESGGTDGKISLQAVNGIIELIATETHVGGTMTLAQNSGAGLGSPIGSNAYIYPKSDHSLYIKDSIGEYYIGGADTGWINGSFQSGWANFSTAGDWDMLQYRRIGPIVYVRGMLKRTSGSGGNIMLLPTGYRPARTSAWFQSVSGGTEAGARVHVQSDGYIAYQAGGDPAAWLSLQGIHFFLS